MTQPAHTGDRRALIVKLGAIGDVVMAVPAAYQLHLQGYRIDWICGPALQPLLSCYSWIHVITVDDKAVLHGGLAVRLRALLGLWQVLATHRYDLCATLYYDRRWRLFTLPVRAVRRLSLSRQDRNFRILPTRHHTNEFARILLGLPDEYRETSLGPLRPDHLPPSPLPRKSAKRIALVPGGASNVLRQQTLRRWPVDRYAAVAASLLDAGFEVLLLGGPDDAWVRDAFRTVAQRPGFYDTLGTLTLPGVISVADTCDLVLTHDTGPLHLAGLSGAPILALFGPTDPGSFLPRRHGVEVLWGGETLACRPCYDGHDFAPCPHSGCMQSISLDVVLHRVDAILSGSSSHLLPILEETPS